MDILEKNKKAILTVFIISLVLRGTVALLVFPNTFLFPDSERYDTVTKNILIGQGCTLKSGEKTFYAHCLPGYPFYLAFIYMFSKGSILATRLSQAVLSSLTVLLIFFLGARFFNKRIGLCAALLWALDPFSVYFSGLVLTETLFIFLFVTFFLFIIKGLDENNIVSGAFSGLVLSCATLVKASGTIFLPFLLPFIFLRYQWNSRRFLIILVVFFTFLLGLVPWWYRNYCIFKSFIALDTRGGVGLYEGNSPEANGGPALDRIKLPPDIDKMGELEQDRLLKKEALSYIKENPWRFLKLAFIKFLRTWNIMLNYRGETVTPFYLIISIIASLPLYLLIITGIWLQRKYWRSWIILLAPAFYFSLMHMFFVGSIRYRLPAMPFLTILAGFGLSYIIYAWWVPERKESFPNIDFSKIKLSVILPVYNEERTLPLLIERVLKVNLKKEIIIVDDGSADKTSDFLKSFSHPDVKIIYHEKNQGKGGAIHTGLKEVTGDIVIIQDGDMEYDPEDYFPVIAPILSQKYHVSYGSRVRGKDPFSYLSFYIGGRFLSFLANLLYGTQITDEPTCYKAFRTDVIRSVPLKVKRFGFCPEVTAQVAKRGYDIYEVPIRYSPRSKKEGKKIRWKDGLEAICILIKLRF